MNIGKAIGELIDKDNSLSQQIIADKAGRSQGHISSIISGRHTPTNDTLKKIALALNVYPLKLYIDGLNIDDVNGDNWFFNREIKPLLDDINKKIEKKIRQKR